MFDKLTNNLVSGNCFNVFANQMTQDRQLITLATTVAAVFAATLFVPPGIIGTLCLISVGAYAFSYATLNHNPMQQFSDGFKKIVQGDVLCNKFIENVTWFVNGIGL